jgi:hypothetical protein
MKSNIRYPYYCLFQLNDIGEYIPCIVDKNGDIKLHGIVTNSRTEAISDMKLYSSKSNIPWRAEVRYWDSGKVIPFNFDDY